MAEREKAVAAGMVACEVCLKEIPASEAKIEEAVDYVLHFCGLECYVRWQEQAKQTEEKHNGGNEQCNSGDGVQPKLACRA